MQGYKICNPKLMNWTRTFILFPNLFWVCRIDFERNFLWTHLTIFQTWESIQSPFVFTNQRFHAFHCWSFLHSDISRHIKPFVNTGRHTCCIESHSYFLCQTNYVLFIKLVGVECDLHELMKLISVFCLFLHC